MKWRRRGFHWCLQALKRELMPERARDQDPAHEATSRSGRLQNQIQEPVPAWDALVFLSTAEDVCRVW